MFPIKETCRGFEDEECDRPPAYALVMASVEESDEVEIVLHTVCAHHAVLWQAYFTKRGES